MFLDTDQERIQLEPPYSVELNGQAETAIALMGSGWHDVNVMVFGPDTQLVEDVQETGQSINDGEAIFTVDQPGQWQFHLLDGVADCIRKVTVEVRPSVD